MERVRTDDETKARFAQAFAKQTARCAKYESDPLQLTEKQVCELYESLSGTANRGIWHEVGRMINKDARWCSKYYSNTFKKHLYTDVLTANDKENLQEYVERMIIIRADKAEIVAACKNMMKGRNVFPNRVESYVHQYFEICFKRLKESQFIEKPHVVQVAKSKVQLEKQTPRPQKETQKQKPLTEPGAETVNTAHLFRAYSPQELYCIRNLKRFWDLQSAIEIRSLVQSQNDNYHRTQPHKEVDGNQLLTELKRLFE